MQELLSWHAQRRVRQGQVSRDFMAFYKANKIAFRASKFALNQSKRGESMIVDRSFASSMQARARCLYGQYYGSNGNFIAGSAYVLLDVYAGGKRDAALAVRKKDWDVILPLLTDLRRGCFKMISEKIGGDMPRAAILAPPVFHDGWVHGQYIKSRIDVAPDGIYCRPLSDRVNEIMNWSGMPYLLVEKMAKEVNGRVVVRPVWNGGFLS